jgi:hypothetical protein
MENEDNNNPPPQQQLHLKIPAFWASNPEAWFAMVEGQFVLKGVTQDTMKFYHVLGSLLETAVRRPQWLPQHLAPTRKSLLVGALCSGPA